MPVITLEAAQLSKEQKQQLAKEFTASAARIMKMPEEAFYVFLKENSLDNVGVGGKLLSDQQKCIMMGGADRLFHPSSALRVRRFISHGNSQIE